MKKKTQEVVIKIQDKEQLNKYIVPDYPKLVCINVYDKFWGPCEVHDPMIKKFNETKDYATKTDFIASQQEFTGEIFSKYTFSAKPKFFILNKGNIVSYIDGLDFPKLQEELEKSFVLLEQE